MRQTASVRPATIGTAGHVDHGKTALVRALTGVETDRLAAERARGISIELGYAPLTLPSGRRVSLIDVPGHERFVRTMVAGATGIDAFLMTIAADDGVMPQTREHAAVLRALDVRRGVVAVTKADAADPDLALAEAADLLPGVAAVAVSARTGAGLDALRAVLERVVEELPARAAAAGPACLHVDRSFTIKGAGTVVTGTLWSGEIVPGADLVLLPRGLRLRVRGVEVHDEARERAGAGQRVAVNLAGVAVRDVARGDVLAGVDSPVRATHVIDAALEFGEHREREPEHGVRVSVHHGTREAPARLHRLGGRFWQIRLERVLIAAAGDRLVVRRLAPPDTLGGGVVLDPAARRHPTSNEVIVRLTRLYRGEPPAPPEPVRPGREPPAAPPPLSASALELEQRLREEWFEPDAAVESPALAELRRTGRAVRVGRTLHYHPDALEEIERRVAEVIGREGQITLPRLRDELATSRKFAQALLEHLDGEKVTRRRPDDTRVLRRRP
ncbi:MAG: selenocysteine-specific translation elongation factor [Solirubrobacteraceae bacterium]